MLFLAVVALPLAFLVGLGVAKLFALGAFRATLILGSVLGLAGCTAGGLLTDQNKPASLRLVTLDATAQPGVEIRPATFSETDASSNSAWCQYLKEDSAAEATILRSPSLNGSVDDSGKLGVSLGVSISSFNRARLIEEAAQVKCRSHLAQAGLQKRAVAAPLGLTAAGYQAKSISILVRKNDLAELREQIKFELRRGNITAEKAASLSGLIDEINLEGNVAKLKAARPAQVVVKAPEAGPFGGDFIQAEAELDAINRKIRTAEAVDVSVSAGWNDLGLRDGFDAEGDSFGGKVSVSFKLGAMAPQRFEHERRGRDAKLKALQEQVNAPDRQIVAQRQAQQQVLADLAQSQARLNETLADTIKLVKVLGSVSSPEFAGTFIAAKIQVVRLLAEKAAVDGSITEIRQNIRPKAG
ncbi:MAG TPA: hypothetical protein VM144_15045 [Aestuariivirga sp.]|nr:hypothetical protein [Aestuariivirga sp.]